MGIFYFIVYYLLFSFLIKKLDLKTPGRGEDDEEVKLYRRSDVDAKKNGITAEGSTADGEDLLSLKICQGLGGKRIFQMWIVVQPDFVVPFTSRNW